MREAEFGVVGGGLVGMAIAYGLVRKGRSVVVFDEHDQAFRASRGNFGLIWVQGKGAAMPSYARWTRSSAQLWPQLAAELLAKTKVDVEVHQPGGVDFALSEDEAEANVTRLESLKTALDGDYPYEYLDAKALKAKIPEVGPSVVGATYFPEDGHANPLYLLRALHTGFAQSGGQLVSGARAERVEPNSGHFVVHGGDKVRVKNVVLCAGLGNAHLAPMVGLHAPVRPVRGQILVTERLKAQLSMPSVQIRQVGEGAIQIGDSAEDVGFDDATDARVIAGIAKRAVAIYPFLRDVRMMRAWSALRVMSPDGLPIYQCSTAYPGASVVTCHSGVTLAAAHALKLAPALAEGMTPDECGDFYGSRFTDEAA